jgi:hypothetical protein
MTEPEPDRFEAVQTADVRAEVTHPDRPLTDEERAHLGLSEEEAS